MMPTFAQRRMVAELRWKTRLILLKYRVRLPAPEPRYEPTGRIVNGIYTEVRRVVR
jgi:hypothetical protein